MTQAVLDPPVDDRRAGARLSVEERHRFEALQGIIDSGKEDFRRVALALREILSRGLYREHGSFEAYVRDRWGFSKAYGFHLAAAGEVILEQHAAGLPAPLSVREARRISDARRAGADRDPDLQHKPAVNYRPRNGAGPRERPGPLPAASDSIEIADGITQQIVGHLRALRQLHASHLHRARADQLLSLLKETILPWPPR